jgi:hypothetical protein
MPHENSVLTATTEMSRGPLRAKDKRKKKEKKDMKKFW